MVNLKYGNNYHIKFENQTVTITFTDGNTLFSQTIIDGKPENKVTVDFCEEQVVLNDGKRLKRVRDSLMIVD